MDFEIIATDFEISKYIPSLDYNEINWSIFDSLEYMNFLEKNYSIGSLWLGQKDLESDSIIPLGLAYSTFDFKLDDAKYLVSYIKNDMGKYTILTCLCYYENYKLIKNQVGMITFASYVETNSFYRNKGLFNLTLKEFVKRSRINPYVITTNESYMGSIYHTVGHLKDVLKKEKYILDVRSFEEINSEYLDKIKKLTRN